MNLVLRIVKFVAAQMLAMSIMITTMYYIATAIGGNPHVFMLPIILGIAVLGTIVPVIAGAWIITLKGSGLDKKKFVLLSLKTGILIHLAMLGVYFVRSYSIHGDFGISWLFTLVVFLIIILVMAPWIFFSLRFLRLT